MAKRDVKRASTEDDEVRRAKRAAEAARQKVKARNEFPEAGIEPSMNLGNHAEVLNDARFDSSPNSGQKAQIMSGLQRSQGNTEVQRLMKSMTVQAKLTVNPPDDQYEREADRAAEAIVKSSRDQVQRQPKVEEEEEGRIHAKSAGGSVPDVSEELEGRINAARGGGQPLPDIVRASLEPQFGHDFRGVRIHADAEADGLSRDLEAKAFTTGQDVFFAGGTYQPGSESGAGLIVHEMAHVVQQGAVPGISRQTEPGKTSGPFTPEITPPSGSPGQLAGQSIPKWDEELADALTLQLRQAWKSPGFRERLKNLTGSERLTEVLFNWPTGAEIDFKTGSTKAYNFGDGVGLALGWGDRFKLDLTRLPPSFVIKPTGDMEITMSPILSPTIGPKTPFVPIQGVGGFVTLTLTGGDWDSDLIDALKRAFAGCSGSAKEDEQGEKAQSVQKKAVVSSQSPDSDWGQNLIGHDLTRAVQRGDEPIVFRQSADGKEGGGASNKEDTVAQMNAAADQVAAGQRHLMVLLLRLAAAAQSVGLDAAAEKAIGKATELAVNVLKVKTEALDVSSGRREVVVDLLKAAANVQELGGDEKAVEKAMSAALAWARGQLKRAEDEMAKNPDRATLVKVVRSADLVYMLGGMSDDDLNDCLRGAAALSTEKESPKGAAAGG